MRESEALLNPSDLRASDKDAVIALFNYLLPRLRRYIHRFPELRTPDAEDIAQDVAFSVFRKLPALIDSLPNNLNNEDFRSQLTRWALTIARNQIIRYRRDQLITSKASALRPEGVDSHKGVENDVLQRVEVQEFIDRIMSALPESDRLIFQRVIEGWRTEEIARIHGIPRVSLYRRLALIRQHIEALGYEPKR